jgi:biotin-dependent carboxylase-like uncharacterized protein
VLVEMPPPFPSELSAVSGASFDSSGAGPLRTIDVVYDGEDLGELARDIGHSVDEVIELHLAREYEVEVLGFLPGFAYLGELDPALQRPRRATPRKRVPAFSVGIAGRYTGVYPSASPGGWHLLGTAGAVRLFDPCSDAPVLLQPGDRVRFRRVERHAPARVEEANDRNREGCLEVITSPPHATIQDLGRPGRRGQGIPSGGAWDVETHIATNRALGNPDTCATLELPLDRFRGRVAKDVWYSVDGEEPVRATAGDIVEVLPNERAVRYLGIEGGFDGDEVLGSRATLLVAGLGGLDGRRVRKGDWLDREQDRGPKTEDRKPKTEDRRPKTEDGDAIIHVLPGPHLDRFTAGAFDRLLEMELTVSPLLDRTGTRLDGGKLPRLDQDAGAPMPMLRGAIQVSTDGTPIVLGPDAATTGGYPVIAVVRRDAQSELARLRPGARLRLRTC